MEISVMVEQLKSEKTSLGQTLSERNTEMNQLRFRIGVLEKEIQALKDKHDAISMAIESLELVNDSKNPVEISERPVPEFIRLKNSKDTPVAEKKPKQHSRKARRIGKFDAKGVKIGEYSSITKAAKDFGWNNVSITKYIENNSKEKQIRLRGYYLEFLVA